MKGLVKSSLATALALATSQAFALGLGPIQVKSGLNQPLVAEIPVIADSAVEANELRVDLATAEDFARVGLNRGRVGVPIEFSVGTSGKQTVIKLTTKEIVREPFLDFLIQVNWSKGKLLREYTVLLDPPVAPAVVKSVKPAAAAPTPPVAAPRPAPAPAPAPRPAPPPVAAPAPAAPPVAKEAAPPPAPKPAPAPRAVAPSAAAGEYGPVKKGETLSSIAGDLDAGGDLNQVMLALLKANPKAFYRDNVNALKSGAVLRIPSAEEVAAAGSVRAAASAIRAQNESWRDAAKPTQVNQAGGLPPLEPPAPAAKPTPAGKSEHLALVPPKAGSGNESSGAERPGAGSGNAKEAAEARAELARTKETLATKEQEATELKSRVKQLEDINDKGRHLISLKDSEIAELQNKLKELQAKANAKPAAAPAAPGKQELAPVAKIPDIVPVPAASKSEAPPVVDKVAEAPKPAEPAKSEKAEAPKPGEPAKTEAAAAPAPAASPAAAPAANAPAAPTGAVVTPLPDNATTQTSTAPAPAPKAAAPKPAAPAPAPAPEQPWYTSLLSDNPYALYGVGGVLLLIGLWALSKVFGKKKPAGSVRPQFGSGPQLESAAAEPTAEQHEQELRDRLAHDPHDIDASMELLRHYYVQGDAQRFESLAENLHEHVHEDSVEWEEVRAMGEGLSPHHHLFAAAGHAQPEPMHPPVHGGFAEPEVAAATTQRFDFEDLADHMQAPAPAPAAKEPEVYTPDFDLGHAHEEAHGHVERPREPARAAPAPAPVYETVAAPRPAAQEFSSAAEDTIGTRLDLARAYLDMGDPEGARSMLDEVLAEGNAAQKEEAHKLLEELRSSR